MMYLHLIDGKPGYFDGEQIVYAEDRSTRLDEYHVCLFRESLRTIEEEQRKSEEYRLRHKWDVPRYGYVVIGRYARTLAPPSD